MANCGLQQKFPVSWFWRQEIQKQGVGRAILPPEAEAENLPSPSFWWLRHSFLGGDHKTPVSGLISTQLCPVCLCPLFIRTWVIGFRACLDKRGWSHLKILHLILSAKTLFPNRATFVGSGGYDKDSSFQGGPPFNLPQDVTAPASYD